MNPQEIFVTNIRAIKANSVATYSCDAFIRKKNLTIRGVLLMEKGENRWINFPSNKWDINGETKYQELITFHDPIETHEIKVSIKKAIDDHILGKTEGKKDEIENLPF